MRLQELLEEQWELGVEAGYKNGVEIIRRFTAEKLLCLGMDIDIIMDITDYSRDEICEMGLNL